MILTITITNKLFILLSVSQLLYYIHIPYERYNVLRIIWNSTRVFAVHKIKQWWPNQLFYCNVYIYNYPMQKLNKINTKELFLYLISAVWCAYIGFYLIFAFLK